MELVSIITPCYNSAGYIAETIESVLSQTYTNWEMIIVDDKSTDQSIEVVESFKDNRIKLVKATKNGGAAVARNLGIDVANGRYMTFLDSDDLWKPEFLAVTIDYLKTNDETLVYTSYHRVDENLNPCLPDFVAVDKVDFHRLLFNCPIFVGSSLLDVSKTGKIKIPLVDLREDHAFWFEVLRKTKYARGLQNPLSIYRIRKGSVSRNKYLIAWKQFLVYYKFLKLSLPSSVYYTFCWAFNGMKKYGKL